MTRKSVTLYLESESYLKLKKYARMVEKRSVSEAMSELIRKRVAEIEGVQVPNTDPAEYEALKRQHSRLDKEEESLKKQLTKKKVYDDLRRHAYKHGLDFKNCSNADEVAPKLLTEWEGGGEIHQFITLIETVPGEEAGRTEASGDQDEELCCGRRNGRIKTCRRGRTKRV